MNSPLMACVLTCSPRKLTADLLCVCCIQIEIKADNVNIIIFSLLVNDVRMESAFIFIPLVHFLS